MREYLITGLEPHTEVSPGLYCISMSDDSRYDGGLELGLDQLLSYIARAEGYSLASMQLTPLEVPLD